jgi:hypothetical protein
VLNPTVQYLQFNVFVLATRVNTFVLGKTITGISLVICPKNDYYCTTSKYLEHVSNVREVVESIFAF